MALTISCIFNRLVLVIIVSAVIHRPGELSVKEKDAQFTTDRRMIMYVEKDNGSYQPIETGSYMIQNYFDDFLQKKDHLQKSYAEKLRKAEISPIEYYRVLLNMGVSDLAGRVGISTRKVRKHLLPEAFASISVKLLQRYAEVFRIPLANLFQLIENREEKVIQQLSTQNPLLVTTKIGGKESERNDIPA